MGTGDPTPIDFEVTKYGHDRAHELELNKFTHALEVEQLKLLILLNGGAAAALLTFAEESNYPMSREGLFYPVLFWLAGLSIAAAATILMQRVQAGYTKAYRHRRHATEWRQLVKQRRSPKNLLGLPEPKLLEELSLRKEADFLAARKGGKGDVLYDKVATLLREKASWWSNGLFPLSLASIVLFLAGAVTAGLVATSRPASGASPAAAANLSTTTR